MGSAERVTTLAISPEVERRMLVGLDPTDYYDLARRSTSLCGEQRLALAVLEDALWVVAKGPVWNPREYRDALVWLLDDKPPADHPFTLEAVCATLPGLPDAGVLREMVRRMCIPRSVHPGRKQRAGL